MFTRNSAPEETGFGDKVAFDPGGMPVAIKVTALGRTGGDFAATMTMNVAVEPAGTDWEGVGTMTSKSTGAIVVVVAEVVVASVVDGAGAFVVGAGATVGSGAVVVGNFVVVAVALGATDLRLVVVVRFAVIFFFVTDVAAAAEADGDIDVSDSAVRATIPATHDAANWRQSPDFNIGSSRFDRCVMASTLPGSRSRGKDHARST